MEVRIDSIDFSLPLRGSGPRVASKTVVFPRNVVGAVAGLTGYQSEYSHNEDHHFGSLDLRLSTEINANVVTVTGRFGLRDWSGDWDDDYDGSINFAVLAELESINAPPARGDLAITGMELNQAIQFYRTQRFLDPANVHPDNSIFLIDGKNTGVRVYVDYDATSGLPVIGQLGGELTVSGGAGTTVIAPIAGPIVPKRDAAINQALSGDTLNFMIPASLSTGVQTITCRVFDQADPTQSSASFHRTLVFTAMEPMNIFLVGVQTLLPAAAAPTQAAIAAAFTLLQKTYPRGVVQFTGFTTMTLAPQIVGSMASSGCGSGWSTLLDQLRDMRGGSDDIYFGGLPAGIFASGVVGCSPVGDRIAASFIDLPATIPHEVGHSLGRNHPPCRSCAQPPQDPDNNFPQYNTFNSDSIGVFGFDPTANAVFDPASALDFMTAFVPPIPWISPYTHQALLGSVPGGPAPAGGMTLVQGDHMTLFLGLEISRNRDVARRVSFHHPAPLQGTLRCKGDFSYELLDKEGRTLDCGDLHCLCESEGCACWPKTTRDALPFPEGATHLNVYANDTLIYDEAIPDPPHVKITGHAEDKEGVHLSWESTGDAKAYLVHYRDRASGKWRGLAPRLEDDSVLVPRRLFGKSRKLTVRVLASSGIATGFAEIELEAKSEASHDTSIRLVGVDATRDGPATLPAVAQGLATDASGAAVPDDALWWYDTASGNTLGRGRYVDLRQLPQGRHAIRLVVKGHGSRAEGKTWVVERTKDAFVLHAAMCDPDAPPRKPPHEHPHPTPPKCED